MLQYVKNLFYIDSISIILLALVLFIGICIGSFAFRYMKGDSQYKPFFVILALLVFSVGILVTSDHLCLLFGAWCLSNFFLVKLMTHKSSWKPAKNSGLLTAKNYFFGAACIGLAFILFYQATGEMSIRSIIYKPYDNISMTLALLLLLIGAMTQSAIIPFHSWLISSLNSPTPVSAMMHAGLVNGGGFLITRFAPIYLKNPLLLNFIFVVGIVSAIIGTLWKLMQNDVKRMLACSTVGQMGFMLAQCGLGLFPSAIAHLFTHGLFKAYLFMSSGSAAQEKRLKLEHPPKASPFFLALICGFIGSISFAIVSGKSWLAKDSTLVLLTIAFLAASQSSLPILSLKIRFKTAISILVSLILGLSYGAGVYFITKVMQPLEIMQPQALNSLHIIGIIFLIASWLSILFFEKIKGIRLFKTWILKGYVHALNASQPHPKTITANRNQYKFL